MLLVECKFDIDQNKVTQKTYFSVNCFAYNLSASVILSELSCIYIRLI